MSDLENRREQTRKMLIAKLNAPSAPPLEAATKFLSIYFADNSYEEAGNNIAGMVAENPRSVIKGIEGIDSLLANPPSKPGILAHLVAWEANWVLDDPSDEGARQWLSDVSNMVHNILKASRVEG